MGILSLGMDLVQVERVEDIARRRGERFLERVFTPGERAYCERRKRPALHFAGRFAVKEAVMKVLGTGWAQGVTWTDIEVRREPAGAPHVVLHGATAELARARGIARIHVTITHDGGLAAAVAVAEG